jgi:hypothetical protein
MRPKLLKSPRARTRITRLNQVVTRASTAPDPDYQTVELAKALRDAKPWEIAVLFELAENGDDVETATP